AQDAHRPVARRPAARPDGAEGALGETVADRHAQAEALLEGAVLRLGEGERGVAEPDRVVAVVRPRLALQQDVEQRPDGVELGGAEPARLLPEAGGRG